MRKKILTEQLIVGMFVELPLSWTEHPFLKNRFLIKNQDQIKKIRACGVKQVMIDTELGDPKALTADQDNASSASEIVLDPKDQETPAIWNPETLVPDALFEAMRDAKMASELKAKAVYDHSKTMIE